VVAPVARPELPANAGRVAASGAQEPSLLLRGTDVLTDFVPWVSNAKDAATAITGINPVTGEKVGTFGRVMAGVFAIPAAGNLLKYVGKGGKYVLKGGKAAYEAIEVARAGSKIAKGVERTLEREVVEGTGQRAEKELAERTEKELAEQAEKEAQRAAKAGPPPSQPSTPGGGGERVITVTPSGVAVLPETLAKQGTSHMVGNFTGLSGKSVDEIVARVPKDWKMVPQDRGAGIKFIDSAGFERIRLHGPSARAPAGSNSASGWTLRVMDQQGKYYDDAGRLVTTRANAGHIPIAGNPNAP
jgi:hypothetical protein